MATFYLDFENGNDANDGTTFANRWKTITNGATAARIAPGDTIRIMGSPAPTSLGINGTWTSAPASSSKGISGATNATPISITCTAHGYSTGDTVVITGVGGNTNANGTWEITVTGANTFTLDDSVGNATYTSGGVVVQRNFTRVKLASALTQNIASTGPGRAAWTPVAGGNVTTSLNTEVYKEGLSSDSVAIAAGFTTGLAAYWPTGTLNLSGYQQVSFWIRQPSGTVGAAGAIDLRLCSDTAGATAVNTISIPNLAATGTWMPVTVDLGTNLGSSIQSIALYVNTDNGAQTFLLNNIIACKASSAADSLTLTSLIGKNTTGETWWGIQSINGTRLMLDTTTNTSPYPLGGNDIRGYYGPSETVTTWKRETIKLAPQASPTATLNNIQESGSAGSPITYSGGWDRTSMSTQSLETWIDHQNGNGVGVQNNVEWINLEKLAAVRCYYGFQGGSFSSYNIIAANNNSVRGLYFDNGPLSTSLVLGSIAANGSNAFSISSGRNIDIVINDYVVSNSNTGVVVSSSQISIRAGSGPAIIANSRNDGLEISSACTCTVSGISMSDNSRDVGTTNTYIGVYSFYNCNFNSSTEVGFITNSGAAYKSSNHDKTINNHKVFQYGALVSSATDQRHTASGISWKIQPTDTQRNERWPISLPISKVACAANSLVTVKAWMRRTNTGLTMRLVCKGSQIAGVASDVTSSMTAAANTWEEVTITFTPTEIGVVEITAEAYGGSTYSGWVDDLTVSQA